MVAKKNEAKYLPMGEYLSTESAYLQASSALDVAAQLSIEARDVEGLNHVAALYIELGTMLSRINAGEEDEEVDEEALAKKVPLGFRPVEIVPVKIDEETTVDE